VFGGSDIGCLKFVRFLFLAQQAISKAKKRQVTLGVSKLLV